MNKENKRKKKFNSLKLISPFFINIESIFYYNLEEFTKFNIFTNDLNKYKLIKEELDKLNEIVNNIHELNKMFYLSPTIKIIPELYENYKKLEIIKKSKNYKTEIIQKIISDNFPNNNYSLRKINNIYETNTQANIDISTISNILKYIFNIRYLKTAVKPKILSDIKYIRKSYFLIQLITKY